MPEKSSVFDMIGPVMIGPSSSHTAGVVRIAKAGIKVLGAIPEEAEIIAQVAGNRERAQQLSYLIHLLGEDEPAPPEEA